VSGFNKLFGRTADLSAIAKLPDLMPFQELAAMAERMNAEIRRSIAPVESALARFQTQLKQALESHAVEIAKLETFELVVPEFMRDLHRPLAFNVSDELRGATVRNEPLPYGNDGEKRRIGF
jgi:hypothetical protein